MFVHSGACALTKAHNEVEVHHLVQNTEQKRSGLLKEAHTWHDRRRRDGGLCSDMLERHVASLAPFQVAADANLMHGQPQTQ